MNVVRDAYHAGVVAAMEKQAGILSSTKNWLATHPKTSAGLALGGAGGIVATDALLAHQMLTGVPKVMADASKRYKENRASSRAILGGGLGALAGGLGAGLSSDGETSHTALGGLGGAALGAGLGWLT
jgi:hypothetical protein